MKFLGSTVLLLLISKSFEESDVDTIIIGAGIAGLSAAEELVRNGHSNIMVLESLNRIGGRMWTTESKGGFDVDLGARWIHGKDNNIFTFTESNGILGENVRIEDVDAVYNDARFYTSAGRKISDELAYYGFLSLDQLMKADVEISLNTSMREYFDDAVQNFIKSDPSSTPQEIEDYKVVMEGVGGILETEFAEDLNKIPAAVILAGGDLLDLDNVIIPGGTKSIINFLLDKLPSDVIKIGEKVTNIDWSGEIVEVSTKWGKCTANQVIVTVPLGVLKADHKSLFTPNLDAKKVKAINNLEMGCVGTIFLEWDQPWWSGNQVIFMGWTKEERESQKLPEEWHKSVNSFISERNNGADNLLWMGISGDGCRVADTLPDTEVGQTATNLLRQFTGDQSIPPPNRVIRNPWSADPNFRGAYSYPSFNTEVEDFANLVTPLTTAGRPKVFFAGEHTSLDGLSTMQGGRASGLEQAQQILKN